MYTHNPTPNNNQTTSQGATCQVVTELQIFLSTRWSHRNQPCRLNVIQNFNDTHYIMVGDSQVQFGYLNIFFVCFGQDIYRIQDILDRPRNEK